MIGAFLREGETAINVTATQGQDVGLSCPGEATNANIRWWKETESGDTDRIVFHGHVTSDYTGRMSFDNVTGILTIHHADLDDNGIYWCGVGFDDQHEIRLTVHGKF